MAAESAISVNHIIFEDGKLVDARFGANHCTKTIFVSKGPLAGWGLESYSAGHHVEDTESFEMPVSVPFSTCVVCPG